MTPTDHFIGRVYEWPVSKEQFNHIINQLDKAENKLDNLYRDMSYNQCNCGGE